MQCSFAKQQCATNATCTRCLDTLLTQDVRSAIFECVGTHANETTVTPSALLDTVVYNCGSHTNLICEYWKERCRGRAECWACLQAMSYGASAGAVIEGSSHSSCEALRAASNEPFSNLAFLNQVFVACPESSISNCAELVSKCVMQNPYCAACLNGSAANASQCHEMLSNFEIPDSCSACPAIVSRINEIVIATAVVGGLSVIACLVVIVQIIAHGRDAIAMRDRIIVGIMIANSIYSSANAIPLNLVHTGFINCGASVLHFSTVRYGRACWFGGKYGMVFLEIMIVGTSIASLRRGAGSLRPRVEATLLLACLVGGLSAFAGFLIISRQISENGFDSATQREIQLDQYQHLDPNDAVDDDTPDAGAARRFDSTTHAYRVLEQEMLQVWCTLLGVAIAIWFVLRWTHVQLAKQWQAAIASVDRNEAADAWAQTRRAQWDDHRMMLTIQKHIYAEVVVPLEPYVAVFVAFGIVRIPPSLPSSVTLSHSLPKQCC